ncbi:AzlC family ABC transporter permease [Paracoccus aminophilus]|nr:AzlC family ABC transporter permease [Paracoccus aminophilus]
MIQSMPFLLVVLPFAVLFGVVASNAGLDLAKIAGFSLLVLAGASQFTALQLIGDHASMVLIIVSALAVNLRLAMYSAALVPWLGATSPRQRALVAYLLIDQTYALSLREFEENPQLSLRQRLAYFCGTAALLCPLWVLATLVGATAGNAIPDSWALDFAVPITFLAMIAPMLRTPAHIAAALVSVLASLAFAFLPSGLGLLVAAPLAMATGAGVEILTERLRPQVEAPNV